VVKTLAEQLERRAFCPLPFAKPPTKELERRAFSTLSVPFSRRYEAFIS